MIHNFDTNIAEKYGINAAIILQNMYYWIEKNRANEKHFHDGYYWTYNSLKAFEELFPYMSTKQIRGALEKRELLYAEITIIPLMTGRNGMPLLMLDMNYSMRANALFQKGKWKIPKGQMDCPKRANQYQIINHIINQIIIYVQRSRTMTNLQMRIRKDRFLVMNSFVVILRLYTAFTQKSVEGRLRLPITSCGLVKARM